MFKKILCSALLLSLSVSLWSEDLTKVISYYQPDMSNGFIYISKADLTLTLVDHTGRIVVTYPIACGRNYGPKTTQGDYKTPEGYFLLQKIHDASGWGHNFHDGKGFIPHAYGPYFMRLQTGFSGIGIHGTHDPESIGTRATEGCIRLENSNAAALEQKVTLGMPVIIGSENGVESLIASHTPRPERINLISQKPAQRPVDSFTASPVTVEPVTLNRKPVVIAGQIDIEPEKDLVDEPLQPAVVAPEVKPTAVEPKTKTAVAESEIKSTASEHAKPADKKVPEEVKESARDLLREPVQQSATTSSDTELKYEVVVEEVTGPDGEVKYEVHYKPIRK